MTDFRVATKKITKLIKNGDADELIVFLETIDEILLARWLSIPIFKKCKALHLAVKLGHDDIISVLIDYGARVAKMGNLCGQSGNFDETVFYHVLIQKDEFSPMIINPFKDHILDALFQDPGAAIILLNSAAELGYIEVVKTLLTKYEVGSNTKQMYCTCYEPFNAGSVKYMVPYMRKTSLPQCNGWYRPLYGAIKYGKIKIVRLLIKNEADVNVTCSSSGDFPINIASTYGQLSIIRLLIKKGADINAQGFEGRSPLHTAMNTKTVKLLNKLEANPFLEDTKRGFTPNEMISRCIARDQQILLEVKANCRSCDSCDCTQKTVDKDIKLKKAKIVIEEEWDLFFEFDSNELSDGGHHENHNSVFKH